MSEKERQYMPQSSAGLMRYGETSSKLKIRPTHVVAISIIFGGIVMILKLIA